MEYIFQEQFLPLSEFKQPNVQYYQWVQKKRRQKERAEQDQLRKRLLEIEEDETTRDGSRIKGYKQDLATKRQKKDKMSASRAQELYEKNIIWRQTVDQKLDKLRVEQQEETYKRDIKNTQPVNMTKEKKWLKQAEHRGPIKAWGERFDHYLRTKQGVQQPQSQSLFYPIINEHSKRMTDKTSGKVEDRLIEYGERLKQKKIDLQQAEYEQLFGKKQKESNISVSTDMSDAFFRLFKDGQKINRKRNQYVPEYSFTPEINKTSASLASRVSQIRKPLYQSKLSEENKVKQKQKQKNESKKHKGEKARGFNDFLKRNQVLLSKIEHHKYKKTEYQKLKENKENSLCTFAPQLNPRSRKIVQNRSEINHSKIEDSECNICQSQQKISQQKNINSIVSEPENRSSFLKMVTIDERQEERQSPQKQENKMLINSSLYFNSSGINISILDERSISYDRMTDPKRPSNILKQMDSDIPTDRLNDQKKVINQQFEEDSIEKAKAVQWQNQLEMMELQIEQMMKRVSN